MSFAVTWYWNSGTDDSPTWTAFDSDNLIKMVGGVYGTSVPANKYQSGMHLQTSSSTDTDACASPHLSNLQYIASDKVALRGTYSGTLGASFPAATACLKVVITDAASPIVFTTESGGLFFYDGTTPATAPTDLTVQGLEQGDSSWTSCGGSSNTVSIGDKTTPATSQTFYVGVSVMPTNTGSIAASLRFTIDYDAGGGVITLTSDVEVEFESAYCDALHSDHILNLIATSSTKPILKELLTRSVDNIYGSTSSTTYGSPRQIVGLVISDSGYYSRGFKNYGIELKSTPALLVPVTCKYIIGSRVYDLLTESWYEITEEADVIKHFATELMEESNYREYGLVRVQGDDI